MRRLHAFEWEDQSWLPRVFRDFITDHLKYTHSQPMREGINLAIARQLSSVLDRSGSTTIVDLCSGAGGPVSQIGRLLAERRTTPVRIVVTDLFPNESAFRALEAESAGLIHGRYQATDAADVPGELEGVRTIFTAIHHFTPRQVQGVLADAVRKRAPIAVFEPLERRVQMAALVGAMSFLRGLTHTHRVGRLTVARSVLTYIVPVAPMMFAWDGMISCLRSYNADELLAIANQVEAAEYAWEAGSFYVSGPFGPMPTTFLIGLPATGRPE